MDKKLASALVVVLAMSGAPHATADEDEGFWSKFLQFFSTERADAEIGVDDGEDEPFGYITGDDNDDGDGDYNVGMDGDVGYDGGGSGVTGDYDN